MSNTDHTVGAVPDELSIDGSAFAEWYRSSYPQVRTAVGMIAEPGAADDATAEAFARAYQHWARVGEMQSPTGWTYRVAENVLRRAQRRATMERRILRRVGRPDPAVVPAGQFGIEIEEALASLPGRMRTAIVLRYFADLSEDDVAQAMGLTVGGASSLLTKARAHLRATRHEDDRRSM